MDDTERAKILESVDVVIVLEGGLVQSIFCKKPGACVVIDYDTDFADDDTQVSRVREEGVLGDGSDWVSKAFVHYDQVQAFEDLHNTPLAHIQNLAQGAMVMVKDEQEEAPRPAGACTNCGYVNCICVRMDDDG